MPYIVQRWRAKFNHKSHSRKPGELNYEITKLITSYVNANGGMCYDNINAVVGVLECAKLELYRRLAAPYEDEMKKTNGEVYFCKGKDGFFK